MADLQNCASCTSTDPRILEELARVLRKRRNGCPVLLGVELASAGLALGLSQADIDAAHELADLEGRTP
jgi:hypothetical protein